MGREALAQDSGRSLSPGRAKPVGGDSSAVAGALSAWKLPALTADWGADLGERLSCGLAELDCFHRCSPLNLVRLWCRAWITVEVERAVDHSS